VNSGVLMLGLVLGIGLQCLCEQGKPIPLEQMIPTLETSLQQLTVEAQRAVPQAEELASRLGMDWEEGRVCVVVETDGSLSASDVAHLGGEVLLRADAFHLLEVEISAACLMELASLPGVKYVRTPYRPVPHILSEGVELSGALTWQQEGYSGQGIRVAVIDLGFKGLVAALSAGELANVVFTRDYTGDGMETGIVHGTACAEVVHDMAPQAELLLMKFDTDVELANAISDAISQGVDVITCSVGWYNTNFYDGTGIIPQIFAQAVNSGILCVTSAGNSGVKHWEGDWHDADGDGWLDFAPGDEENNFYLETGQMIKLYLTWDAWPATDQDYELYLVDEWGNIVAESTWWQTGTQEPVERILYTALAAGDYGVKVAVYYAPDHPRMELFCSRTLEYTVSESSISAPGNAPFILTVGAIDWRNWETGPQELFSSQGPTNSSQYAASIIKPDICGADAVSGMSYGAHFYGTSASSPHVAGAAALVWSRHPSWNASDVRDWLESNAVDMGALGKDNIYGYGRLSLPPSSNPADNSHTYGTAGGWYMVSVPLNSGSSSSLFGTTAYTYNPAAGLYDVASTIEPSKGYWVYLPANKVVTDAGDQVTSDVTSDISTAGWWQISAPWSYPKDAIQVTWICSSCGGSRKMTKSWADAAAAGWIRGDIYGYKASDGDYNTPSILDPWYGYWVMAKISGLSLTLLSALGTPVSMAYAPMAAPLAAPPLVFAPADLPPMPADAMGSTMILPNPILPSHGGLMNPLCFCSPTQEDVEAIRVQVFDLAGRLVYEHEEDGARMEWQTENNYGEHLANGVYLYKLYMRVNGVWIATEVSKLVILR
jgi:subtilisin family serine protease